jgi:hypothetical protein
MISRKDAKAQRGQGTKPAQKQERAYSTALQCRAASSNRTAGVNICNANLKADDLVSFLFLASWRLCVRPDTY